MVGYRLTLPTHTPQGAYQAYMLSLLRYRLRRTFPQSGGGYAMGSDLRSVWILVAFNFTRGLTDYCSLHSVGRSQGEATLVCHSRVFHRLRGCGPFLQDATLTGCAQLCL